MTYSQRIKTELTCDGCRKPLVWNGHLTRAMAEKKAREAGWRKDKLGRNLCPAHPVLRSSGS